KKKQPTTTTTTKSTPKKKQPTKTGTGGGTPSKSPKTKLDPIPTTLAAASYSDRLILNMRDSQNSTWADINSAWKAETGLTVGQSTLRMRYNAMKANFSALDDEDETLFRQTKDALEAKFAQEKWRQIAEQMEAVNGKKFPPATLQKKWKEWEK
ncbi:uncharacterized protein BO97DRAFT_328730, partial [Aspergillus homomorphus CBS 101889]